MRGEFLPEGRALQTLPYNPEHLASRAEARREFQEEISQYRRMLEDARTHPSERRAGVRTLKHWMWK